MQSERELNATRADYVNDSELPLRDVFEEWRPELARAERQLRGLIRKYPLAALATVTLAGLLLGRWLRR